MTPFTWSYCGVMVWRPWGAAFLVNMPGGFTRVLVSYQRTAPVRILYLEAP